MKPSASRAAVAACSGVEIPYSQHHRNIRYLSDPLHQLLDPACPIRFSLR